MFSNNSQQKKYVKSLNNMEHYLLRACKKYNDAAIYIKKNVGYNQYVMPQQLGGFTLVTSQNAMKRANRYMEKSILEGREAIYQSHDLESKKIVLAKAKLTVDNYLVGKGGSFFYEIVDSNFQENISIVFEQIESALGTI